MTIKFFKSRWLQNSYEILERFWAEFWLSPIVSNNLDDFEILQESDGLGIFVKKIQDFGQKFDDRWILILDFKNDIIM